MTSATCMSLLEQLVQDPRPAASVARASKILCIQDCCSPVGAGAQAMSESQRHTIRSHIEAELRAMEANPKADGRAQDRIRKLLNKVNAILPQQVGRPHCLNISVELSAQGNIPMCAWLLLVQAGPGPREGAPDQGHRLPTAGRKKFFSLQTCTVQAGAHECSADDLLLLM